MDDVEVFRQQINVMSTRLERMYIEANQSSNFPPELVPVALMELGVAAEELQVANEELRQQNEQIDINTKNAATKHYYYQSLLNNIPEAYLVTTTDGKIQEANQMAARLFGVSYPLTNKLLVSFVPPDARQAFRNELNRVVEGKQPRNWSVWFQPPDTVPIHLALTTAAVYCSGNKQVSLHWILREISKSVAFEKNGSSSLVELDNCLRDRPLRAYNKGESIPLSPQTFWQVDKGLVKLHTLTEENEEVLLGFLGPAMPFSAGTSFIPVYQATALSDVQLKQFSLAEVEAFPALAQLLLPKLNQRSQQMEALLAISGQRRVEHRLYHLLRLLREVIGEPIANGMRLSLRLTHQDLANACCTSRVSVTRFLGAFQRQRKIAIDSKGHIILSEAF